MRKSNIGNKGAVYGFVCKPGLMYYNHLSGQTLIFNVKADANIWIIYRGTKKLTVIK